MKTRKVLCPAAAAGGLIPVLSTAGAVAIAYFLAARLGLALLSAGSGVAVFWPASGLAAGILITFGPRARPALVIGVVVGTVAANLMSDRSLATSIFKGFCNAGEAVLAAWLLERWFGWPFTFGDLGRVGGFLAAAGVAAATSAIGGAATMTLLHTAAPFWDAWRTWFLSDGVGIVVVAPVVIGLGQAWREPPSRSELMEGIGVLALLALSRSYVMGYSSDSWLSFNPSIVVLPLLLWLAARCPPVFAIAGAFVASILVIWATTYGIGRYGDAAVPIMERVKGAQAVVATGTVGILVLTVLFVQRKKAEEGLRQSEGQLAKERTMLARLHEVGSRLWLKRDLRQALDEILAGAIELLGADMGAIRIFDATQGVLKIGAHRGFGQEFLDFFREVSAADDSACGRVLRSGERMVIEDVEADTLYASFHPIAHAAGYRAVQSTPIISREGALLGTLATHFRSAHKPTQQDLHLLDLYVHQAAEIIERYKAEDALRESEERLRLTQLRTGIGIWDWNLRTDKLTWTPELEAIFGLEPGTVNCYADFRDRVHPNDIKKVEAARDTAVQRRETFELEFRIIRPSGQVRWVASVGGAFYDEATNEPVRILGNNIDITERKEAELALSERNLQLALAGKAGLVGSYAYDARTETFQISEGCAAIHGLPEGTTTITRSEWRACVHPEDVQRIQAFQSEVVGKRQPEYNVEYRILRSGGEVRWIESRSFISYGSEGQPQRVVGVTIDITERKQAEQRQRALNAELDHRVKNSLATISAVVSHTLKASNSMADFATALEGRVQSMARTHELLSAKRWQGVSVAELVRRELAPYATSDNAEINGPEVILRAEAGQAMAMVLHELATNGAKYGALSTQNGHVSINWEQRLNGHPRSRLVLEWREFGGPSVTTPGKPGYGTRTICNVIPYELRGTVDLAFASEGVRCRLELPANWLINDGEPVSEAVARAPHE